MSKLITRLAPRIALLALLPLALAGCFRVDLGITVNDDGSGTMTMLVAFDESLLSLMQGLGDTTDSAGGTADGDSAPVDPLAMLGGIDPSELPPGVTVEPYQEDEFVGATFTFSFAATDDVAAAIEDAFAATDAGSPFGGEGGAPLEGLILRKEDDGGWLFEAAVPSPAAGQDGLDASMAALLLGDASFSVRIRLPGEVVETNADERGADGELIWHIDPAGDDRALMARTRPASGGSNALLVGGAVLATVLIVGGLGYWVRRRASASASAPSGAGAGAAGGAAEGDPSPRPTPPPPPA